MIPAAELAELEAMRSLMSGPGGEVEEQGGALCTAFRPLPASAMFNRALGVGLTAPATAADLDAIERFFSERGLQYGIPVAPETEPANLAERLEQRGFHRGYAWTKFERGLEPYAAQSDLRVEEVDDGAVFADVFIRAYGTPEVTRPLLERLPTVVGWHCFVAFDGDVPAATAAVFVTEGVGWLGAAGTLPEFRRRGAQSALLAARIEVARRAGCKVVATETGVPQEPRPSSSYRNIVRAGFEPVYVRENYLSAEGADTSGTRA